MNKSGLWPGARRTQTPLTAAHARERARYDEGFLEGCGEYFAYSDKLVPVGTRLTILHFTNGLFFRKLDFTACRRGLCAERAVALDPLDTEGTKGTKVKFKSTVVDCRALGKAKREAARATPDNQERQNKGASSAQKRSGGASEVEELD